ncbi:MAG TPA: NADH-ubiquinone oxidoreductase-F iron-sulfur binding region domain-containing protein [Gemmataceae bacterium]|nr:NADH-ubiquinone oxidoreductase-F iron-sulfur binding region domain-containing protein [Gemmataceae bacterium]
MKKKKKKKKSNNMLILGLVGGGLLLVGGVVLVVVINAKGPPRDQQAKAKGCIPGGISMGIMTEKEFDTPLDFNGPGKVGCLGLGTAAVTVFDEETSIVDVLGNICRFFAHESCGQCTPCREGTGWMNKIVHRMQAGGGRMEDLKILDEVAKNIGIMPGTTICGLADGAGWPVKNAIQKFRGELEEYIQKGEKSPSLALAGAHEASGGGVSPLLTISEASGGRKPPVDRNVIC